jgi:tenascin
LRYVPMSSAHAFAFPPLAQRSSFSCSLLCAVCDAGYLLEDCSGQPCASDCGLSADHGSCDYRTAQCKCVHGWSGPDCSQRACSIDCRGRGQCLNGACVCDEGWVGTNCEKPACPSGCFNDLGQGTCVNKTVCVCAKGYSGIDCGTCTSSAPRFYVCPSRRPPLLLLCCCLPAALTVCRVTDASCCAVLRCVCVCWCAARFPCGEVCVKGNKAVHGHCNRETGHCECRDGWKGKDCTESMCTFSPDCSGHGECTLDVDGTPICSCNRGYGGDTCADILCKHKCHGHGTCRNFQCHCNVGFAGRTCGTALCPNVTMAGGIIKECGNGVCHENRTGCICQDNWTGPNCNTRKCPGQCSGHGICDETFRCRCSTSLCMRRFSSAALLFPALAHAHERSADPLSPCAVLCCS